MARFDHEVCHYFVEDSDRFGQRGGDVAEGVEELFYYCRVFNTVFSGGGFEVREKRGGKVGTFGFKI